VTLYRPKTLSKPKPVSTYLFFKKPNAFFFFKNFMKTVFQSSNIPRKPPVTLKKNSAECPHGPKLPICQKLSSLGLLCILPQTFNLKRSKQLTTCSKTSKSNKLVGGFLNLLRKGSNIVIWSLCRGIFHMLSKLKVKFVEVFLK